ncbi:OLC1v1033722C1 [Oldenlandia corymbosa var. corymbosa]|uniref:OLC1v1033722C1 n=1 Tax=Oldenlandia corymbosa var. corymbosa TaxID=529605 RepID=A0AAV1CQB9_OLDCO|nr:OLC1v1033722C1 [Oldenlandia corymbosa var. corymbosa]
MTSQRAGEFDSRVDSFLHNRGLWCQVQFFMTWISPAKSFRDRQFLVLDSLFKNNPNACLIILSKELDSGPGRLILKPLIDRGYRVAAFDPDLKSLFKNTPVEAWLKDIQGGNKDAGGIPLAQNLSNLMRLAALYKYGGVYLDTDFIVLRDFSGLRNAIGAQSMEKNGKWTRLNNAVLIFDKNHPLLYEFMKEFQRYFDGSKWGHNGPYLVSRVIERVTKQKRYNFTVLPPKAFYPVDWTRIDGFFKRPNDPAFVKWAEAKLHRFKKGNETYGIHLWNRQTGRMKIEKGSIMAELISHHCIICPKH